MTRPSNRISNALRSFIAVSVSGLLLTGLLSGCASAWLSDAMSNITPYRVEIVQGNVVTREQLAQLKPGMTREQVREVLGAPMLTDIFHANRWDYPFTIRRKGAQDQRRNVVVTFNGDVVKAIEAPELPSEREFVAGIGNLRQAPVVPKLELTDEERKALPAAPRASAAVAEPAGVKRDYPPLEATR